MAQITEAKLFEWLGRIYAERQSIAEERDQARRVVIELQAEKQAAEKDDTQSPTT